MRPPFELNPTAGTPKFEVASIKPSGPAAGDGMAGSAEIPGGRIADASVQSAHANAYSVPAVINSKVCPAWIELSERYAVDARAGNRLPNRAQIWTLKAEVATSRE